MKQIDYLQMIVELFRYKTILDEEGTEYVVFSQSELNSVHNIQDRTAFEACENHVHLLNNLKKEDFNKSVQIAKEVAQILLDSLSFHYPLKHFIVFVSLRLYDSMIIRFHQKWENEEPYYNPDDFNSKWDKVIKLET